MKTDSDECVSFRDVARPDSGLARYLRLNAQSAAKPICVGNVTSVVCPCPSVSYLSAPALSNPAMSAARNYLAF